MALDRFDEPDEMDDESAGTRERRRLVGMANGRPTEGRNDTSLTPHSLADGDVGAPGAHHINSMPMPSIRGGAALPVIGSPTPELSERNNA